MKVICPQCGRQWPGDLRACPYCLAELRNAAAASAEEQPSPQREPEAPETPTEDVAYAIGPAEPEAEAVPEPAPELVAEPAVEPMAEPVADLAAESVPEPVSEPITEQAAEPVAEAAPEPTSEPVAEPVAEPVVEPVSEPAAEAFAEAVAEPSEIEMVAAKVKRRRRGRKVWLIVGIIVVLAAIVGFGYYKKWWRTASLEELLPQDCPLVASADAAWWWSATEDIRLDSSVRKAVKKAEETLGISFEKDVVPWMGEAGVAVLDTNRLDPQVVIVAEVRDKRIFARCAKQVQAVAAREAKSKWFELTYEGVPLRRMEISRPYRPPTTVTTALLAGWFVVGIGEGSVERVIDVWQGRTPSLKQSATWAQAWKRLDKLPSKPVAWLACDRESFARVMLKSFPYYPRQSDIPEVAKTMILCAFTEGPDQLRVDTVTLVNSEQLRKFYKNLKASIKPVTGKAAKELPDGTVAAVLFSAPGTWMEGIKQILLDGTLDPGLREMAAQEFKEMAPVEDAMKACTGECAAGLIWREGVGFGFVALGDTSNAGAAKEAALGLRRFAEGKGATVLPKGNLFLLPEAQANEKMLRVLPCWSYNGRWLAFSTHPSWLSSGAKTDIKLPSEVQGADLAAVGNLEFLPSLLDWAKKEAKSPSEREAIELIRQLGLEKASWVAWTNIDPQGGWTYSAAVLRNWQWRKAAKAAVGFTNRIGLKRPPAGLGVK